MSSTIHTLSYTVSLKKGRNCTSQKNCTFIGLHYNLQCFGPLLKSLLTSLSLFSVHIAGVLDRYVYTAYYILY